MITRIHDFTQAIFCQLCLKMIEAPITEPEFLSESPYPKEIFLSHNTKVEEFTVTYLL